MASSSSDRVVLPSASLSVDDFFFTKGTQSKRLLTFLNHLSLGYVETCNAVVTQMQTRIQAWDLEYGNKKNMKDPQLQQQQKNSDSPNKQQQQNVQPEWLRIDNALLPVFKSLLTALELRSLTAISDWGVVDDDASANPLPVPPITSHFRFANSPLVPSSESAAYTLIMGGGHKDAVALLPNHFDKDDETNKMSHIPLLSTANTRTHGTTIAELTSKDLSDRQLPIIISTLVRSLTNSVSTTVSSSSPPSTNNASATATTLTFAALQRIQQVEASHKIVLQSLTNFILDHDADSLGTLDFGRFVSLAIYLHLVHFGDVSSSVEESSTSVSDAGNAPPTTSSSSSISWRPAMNLLSLLWHFTKKFVSAKSFKAFLAQLKNTDRSDFEAANTNNDRNGGEHHDDAAAATTPFISQLLKMMPPLQLAGLLIMVFGDRAALSKAKSTSANASASGENSDATRQEDEEDLFTVIPEVFTLMCPMNNTATLSDLAFVRGMLSSSPHTQHFVHYLDHYRSTNPEKCPFTRCQKGKLLLMVENADGDDTNETIAAAAELRRSEMIESTWSVFTAASSSSSSESGGNDATTAYIDSLLSQREDVLSMLLAKIRQYILALAASSSSSSASLLPLLPFLKKLLDNPRNHHMRPFVCCLLYFNTTDDAELREALFNGPLGVSTSSTAPPPPLSLEDHILITDYLSGDYFNGLLSSSSNASSNNNSSAGGGRGGDVTASNNGDVVGSTVEANMYDDTVLEITPAMLPKGGVSPFMTHPLYEMHTILQHFIKVALVVQKSMGGTTNANTNASASSAGIGPAEAVLASLIETRGDILTAILSITTSSSSSEGSNDADEEKKRLNLLQQVAQHLMVILNNSATKVLVKVDGIPPSSSASSAAVIDAAENREKEEQSIGTTATAFDHLVDTLFVTSPAYVALLAQQLSFLRAVQLLQSVSKFIAQRSLHLLTHIADANSAASHHQSAVVANDKNAEGGDDGKKKQNSSGSGVSSSASAAQEPLVDPKQWKDIAAAFYEALALVKKFSGLYISAAPTPNNNGSASASASSSSSSSTLAGIVVELILTVATDQILLPTLQIQQMNSAAANNTSSDGNNSVSGANIVEDSMRLYCLVINELEKQLSEVISPRVLSVLRIVIFKARQLLEGNTSRHTSATASTTSTSDDSNIETLLLTICGNPKAGTAGGGGSSNVAGADPANALWDLTHDAQPSSPRQSMVVSPSTTSGGGVTASSDGPTPSSASSSSLVSPEHLLIKAFSASPSAMLLEAIVPRRDYDKAFKVLTHLFSCDNSSNSSSSSDSNGNSSNGSVRSDSILLFAFISAQLDSLRSGDISLEDFLSLLDDITDMLLSSASDNNNEDSSNVAAAALPIVSEAPALLCRADLWMHSPQAAQPMVEALAEDLANEVSSNSGGGNNDDGSATNMTLKIFKNQLRVLKAMAAAGNATATDACEESEQVFDNDNAASATTTVPYFIQFSNLYLQPHVTKSAVTSVMTSLIRAKRIAASSTTGVDDFINAINTVSQSVQIAGRDYCGDGGAKAAGGHQSSPSFVWKPAFVGVSQNSHQSVNYLLEVGKHFAQLERVISKASSSSSSSNGATTTTSVQQILSTSHSVLFQFAKTNAFTQSVLESIFTDASGVEDNTESSSSPQSLPTQLSPNDLLSIIVSEYISSQLLAKKNHSNSTNSASTSELSLIEEVNVMRTIERIILFASGTAQSKKPSSSSATPSLLQPSFAPLLLVAVSNHTADYLSIFSNYVLSMKDEDIEAHAHKLSSGHGNGTGDFEEIEGVAASGPLSSTTGVNGSGSFAAVSEMLSRRGLFASFEAQSVFLLMLLGLQRSVAMELMGMAVNGVVANKSLLLRLDGHPIADGGFELPHGLLLSSSSSSSPPLLTVALDSQSTAAHLMQLIVKLTGASAGRITLKKKKTGGAASASGEDDKKSTATHQKLSLTEVDQLLYSVFELFDISLVRSAVSNIFAKCQFDFDDDLFNNNSDNDDDAVDDDNVDDAAEEGENPHHALLTSPLSRSQFAENLLKAILSGVEKASKRSSSSSAISEMTSSLNDDSSSSSSAVVIASLVKAAFSCGSNSAELICQSFISPLLSSITDLEHRCKFIIPTTSGNASLYLRFASLTPFTTQVAVVESTISAFYHRRQMQYEEEMMLQMMEGGGGANNRSSGKFEKEEVDGSDVASPSSPNAANKKEGDATTIEDHLEALHNRSADLKRAMAVVSAFTGGTTGANNPPLKGGGASTIKKIFLSNPFALNSIVNVSSSLSGANLNRAAGGGNGSSSSSSSSDNSNPTLIPMLVDLLLKNAGFDPSDLVGDDGNNDEDDDDKSNINSFVDEGNPIESTSSDPRKASASSSSTTNATLSTQQQQQQRLKLKKIVAPKLVLPTARMLNANPQLKAVIEGLIEIILVLRLSLPSEIFTPDACALSAAPNGLAANNKNTNSSASSSGENSIIVTPHLILRQMANVCAQLWWCLIKSDIPQICGDAEMGAGDDKKSRKIILASTEENKSQKRRELRLLEKINAVVNTEFTVKNAQGANKLSFASIYKAFLMSSSSTSANETSPASPPAGLSTTTTSLPPPNFTCVAWELVDIITTTDLVRIETQYRLVRYLMQSTLLRPIFVVDQHWDKTILGLDMMRVLKERQLKEKKLVGLYKKACEEKVKLPGSGGGGDYDDEDEDEDDSSEDRESDDDDDEEEDTIDSVFGRQFASEPLLLVENLLMCQRIAEVAAILPLIQSGREKECDRLLLKYAYKSVDISPYQMISMNEFPNGKKKAIGDESASGANGGGAAGAGGGVMLLPLKPPKLKCWIPSDSPPKQQTEIRSNFAYTNTPNMPLYRQIVRFCHDQEAAMDASFAFAERLFDSLEDYQNNVTKVLIIDTAEHVLMSLPHRTEKHVRLLRMFQISRHLVMCNWPEHPQQDVFNSQDEVMNLIDKLLAADHTKAAFSIAEVCGVDISGVQTLWTDRVRELLELGLYVEAEEALSHLTAEKVTEMITYVKTNVQLAPIVTGYRAQRNLINEGGGGGANGGSGNSNRRGINNQLYSVRQVSENDVASLLIARRNGVASILKKFGSRMDLLEFHMQMKDYIPAIGIAFECRKEYESEIAEIFLRQSLFTNATGDLRKAMREKDSTLASLRPLIVLCCKTLEMDAYTEELYLWQKWMHDYSRAAHTATTLSTQEVRLTEKLALLKEAEQFYTDAKTQPTIKLPDPPFADDGVELPLTRLTPQQLHFSLIQVRLQQQLITTLNANGIDFNSLSLYCDYAKLGEVAQTLLTMSKLALIELAVTVMDSFHVDVMTTMTRATMKLLEDKKHDSIETLIDQTRRILSLSPAERNGVLYSMLQVCNDDPSNNKKSQKLAQMCLSAMTPEGGRRVVSLMLFGKFQQAMNEAMEHKDYQAVENVYETVNKMSPMTPELQQIVEQTRYWLTRNRR